MRRNSWGPRDQVKRECEESILSHMQNPNLGKSLESLRTPRPPPRLKKEEKLHCLHLYRPWPGPNEEVRTKTGDSFGDSSSQAELPSWWWVNKTTCPNVSPVSPFQVTIERTTTEPGKGRPCADECAQAARRPAKASPACHQARFPLAI